MKTNNTHISSLIKAISVILLIAGCSYWPGKLGMTDDSALPGEYGREAVYEYSPGEDFFATFTELIDNGASIKEIASLLSHCPGKEREMYDLSKDLKCSLLHYAAARGNLDVVKLLIEDIGIGVDVKTDGLGATPLHFAASTGELEVVKYLINNGANADAKDNEGASTLHYATREEHMDVLRFLIEEKQADVNVQEAFKGLTILHTAILRKNPDLDLVEYIIKVISEDTLRKKTKSEMGAFELAEKFGQEEVARLIEESLNIQRPLIQGISSMCLSKP